MDASGYTVFYDMASEAFRPQWPNLLVGAGLAAMFSVLAFTASHAAGKVFGALAVAAVLLFTVWGEWSSASEHAYMRDEFRQGRFETLEGEVTNFRRGRSDCREVLFDVGDRGFRFADCEIVTGFNAAGIEDLSGACVRMALVEIPALQDDRVAWFGVHRGGCAVPGQLSNPSGQIPAHRS